MAKNYHSFTGLTEFDYQAQGEDVKEIKDPERIRYLQEISVSKEQELEEARGDNQVAEIAVANGTVDVEAGFHKLPLEDRIALFGLETSENGLVAVGDDTPPYVAVMFAKTMEDGSREYVGLPKGIFTFSEIEGKTKEDSVEFSSDSSKGKFMPAPIDGFSEEKSMLIGHDPKGSTKMRDTIRKAIFKTKDGSTDTPDTTATYNGGALYTDQTKYK